MIKIWNNKGGGYDPNHKKVLEDLDLDKPDFNEGLTYFGHEKAKIKNCRKTCLKNLETKIKKFMQDGKAIDTTFLKKCLKPSLTVPKDKPINVLNLVLFEYSKKFGDNVVYGKFGGYGHEGQRILLFYEEGVAGVEKRLKELKNILEENNIIGKLGYSTVCEYMHDHLEIGKKSEVRQAQKLLKKLN